MPLNTLDYCRFGDMHLTYMLPTVSFRCDIAMLPFLLCLDAVLEEWPRQTR